MGRLNVKAIILQGVFYTLLGIITGVTASSSESIGSGIIENGHVATGESASSLPERKNTDANAEKKLDSIPTAIELAAIKHKNQLDSPYSESTSFTQTPGWWRESSAQWLTWKALGGQATQSSTFKSLTADYAIDGNSTTTSHTFTNEWLKITLPYAYEFTKIEITNRFDSCETRLDGVVVSVDEVPCTVDDLYIDGSVNGTGAPLSRPNGHRNWSCGEKREIKCPRTGSVIMLKLKREYLQIAEIRPEIKFSSKEGSAKPVTAWSTFKELNAEVELSSTHPGDYGADKAIDGDVVTFCSTLKTIREFLTVKIPAPVEFKNFKITNTGNVQAASRLNGLKLFVDSKPCSAADGSSGEGAVGWTAGETRTITCDGKIGTSVELRSSTTFVNIGEVQPEVNVPNQLPGSEIPTNFQQLAGPTCSPGRQGNTYKCGGAEGILFGIKQDNAKNYDNFILQTVFTPSQANGAGLSFDLEADSGTVYRIFLDDGSRAALGNMTNTGMMGVEGGNWSTIGDRWWMNSNIKVGGENLLTVVKRGENVWVNIGGSDFKELEPDGIKIYERISKMMFKPKTTMLTVNSFRYRPLVPNFNVVGNCIPYGGQNHYWTQFTCGGLGNFLKIPLEKSAAPGVVSGDDFLMYAKFNLDTINATSATIFLEGDGGGENHFALDAKQNRLAIVGMPGTVSGGAPIWSTTPTYVEGVTPLKPHQDSIIIIKKKHTVITVELDGVLQPFGTVPPIGVGITSIQFRPYRNTISIKEFMLTTSDADITTVPTTTTAPPNPVATTTVFTTTIDTATPAPLITINNTNTTLDKKNEANKAQQDAWV